MRNYVIVGNGVAGTTAAENIRKLDPEGAITIVTDEEFPFYYRVRLNDFLSGDIRREQLLAKKEDWYKQHEIDLRLNLRVTGGDPGRKLIMTADGQEFNYNSLLIAAGSHSFIPPIKGAEKDGVFAVRSLRDARAIRVWAEKTEGAVLIGGGLLGLEAGNALRKLGKEVMVVEFFPRLLPRQLDADGAERLQKIMEKRGFSFRLGAKTSAIGGEDQVNGVLLDDGEELPAQMVVISAGVRPNLELAEPLGLQVDKGIKVNERLRTNQEAIYAAGDVAEFAGSLYGIWPAAMEQGKAAGTNMAGGDRLYHGTTVANNLKVAGVDLASAGNIDAEGRFDSRVRVEEDIYKKIVLEDDRIIGCIMLGDTAGFNKITKMMSDKQDVSRIKDTIL